MSLLRSRGESDLSRVRPRRHCGAVNRGCTRTSHSLLSSIRSSARVTCRQSSSAPQPLSVERARPRERLLVDRAGVLIERAAELVDRHSDERVLANVQTNNDPSDRLLPLGGPPASGQTSLEAAARLLSGHARRSREGGGDTTLESQPSGDVRESSQPPPTRVSAPQQTTLTDDDSEFGNVPRRGLDRVLTAIRTGRRHPGLKDCRAAGWRRGSKGAP